MRENGMYPETLKKYKPEKNGNKDGKYYENIVKQDFSCDKPDEKWVGDITYLKTKLGWVYLATVMDLYNREIIGYLSADRWIPSWHAGHWGMHCKEGEARKSL